MSRPLPVIIVTGFLGAGKTSLLHHFITEYQGGSIAVLLEDCGTPNLDARAIRGLCGAMRRSRDVVSEIPADQPDWLANQLRALSAENRFDLVLIEISATKTAADLTIPSDFSAPLPQGIICVIDALDFFRTFSLPQSRGESPDLSIPQRRQIENATLLVFNKCDLVAESERNSCLNLLNAINPEARIIETAYGQISPDLVLQNISSVPPRRSPNFSPGTSALESLSYSVHRPFHPARFWEWFNAEHPGLFRVKGLVWLATRNLLVGGVSRTRWQNSCGGAGIWWDALPREEWPSEPDALLRMHETWHEPFGDRRQELILVGNPSALPPIARQLDACLLTDEEFALSPKEWLAFPDPLPAWDMGDEAS